MKKTPVAKKQTNQYEVTQLKVDLLDPPKIQMRSADEDQRIDQLADSMKRLGLIHPIVVVARGKRFEVVAGARRTQAAKLIDWKTIPGRVVRKTADVLEAIKMDENTIRKDVSPMEEAEYIDAIKAAHGLNQSEIAHALGRAKSWVSERLGILRYPDELKAALKSGEIVYSAAKELANISDERTRTSYISHAIAGGINERVARDWRRSANTAADIAVVAVGDAAAGPPAVNAGPQGYQCTTCHEYHPLPETIMIRICKSCWEVVSQVDFNQK